MEFEINSLEFQKIVKMLGIVARVNTVDSAGRICIEVNDNGVHFTANNGFTAICSNSTGADIKEHGSVSVIYGDVNTFVMSFKPWNGFVGAKKFCLSGDDKQVNITVDSFYDGEKSSKGKLKLSAFNSAVVQKLPLFGEQSFILNSTLFRKAMNKVLYAVDPKLDISVGALQGMNIKFEKDNIYFAGSNGRVLSELSIKNHTDNCKDDIILQYDFVMGLRRLLVDDTQLLWEVRDNRVAVKFDNVLFCGKKLIGYEYPDYRDVFDNYEHYIRFTKEILIDSLSPFSDILNPEDNYRLTFKIEDSVVSLYCDQASMTIEQDIPDDMYFVIDVNGKLLTQSIDAIHDECILVKFSDEDGLLILDAGTSEDQKAFVTPIRRR
jgi:DNA polymerase III sliding clamp (beta) subunit (PCNA family)